MSNNIILHIFGTIGAILTPISFIPQIYITYTTKTTKGLSLWLLILITISSISWLIYATQVGAWYQVITNSISLILMLILFILYYLYHNN